MSPGETGGRFGLHGSDAALYCVAMGVSTQLGVGRVGRVGLLLVVLLSCISVRGAGREELPAGVEKLVGAFGLVPQRVDVAVGPDGRIWTTTADTYPKQVKLEDAKAELAAQFGSASPQLRGVKIAMFEPAGRVWVAALAGGTRTTLLGYDGREWVEHAVNVEGVGMVAGSGWRSNLFAGGRAYFLFRDRSRRRGRRSWDPARR